MTRFCSYCHRVCCLTQIHSNTFSTNDSHSLTSGWEGGKSHGCTKKNYYIKMSAMPLLVLLWYPLSLKCWNCLQACCSPLTNETFQLSNIWFFFKYIFADFAILWISETISFTSTFMDKSLSPHLHFTHLSLTLRSPYQFTTIHMHHLSH